MFAFLTRLLPSPLHRTAGHCVYHLPLISIMARAMLIVALLGAVLPLGLFLMPGGIKRNDASGYMAHFGDVMLKSMAACFDLIIHDPCSLPILASLAPCAMNGAAARIALSHLVNEQASGFEMLSESSDASIALVTQLTATRMAVGDLIPLVKHSHLQHRAELHVLLEALADDAKDAARYLQQLSARINSGTDRYVCFVTPILWPRRLTTLCRITAVLGHTSRVLLGAPPPSMTSLQCTIFDIVVPI